MDTNFSLPLVFEEYFQITNKDVEDSIKDEMSGTFQMGMLALGKDLCIYFMPHG